MHAFIHASCVTERRRTMRRRLAVKSAGGVALPVQPGNGDPKLRDHRLQP